MDLKKFKEQYALMGWKGLILFSLYRLLYYRLQNFKSTLNLIEWSKKESGRIEKARGYLMLRDLPSFSASNFYFRPFGSDPLVVKQHFFDNELAPVLKFFQAISHVPRLMLDAGGNIGAASRYIQLHYPEIKTIVVEPYKENCKVIEMNLTNVDYKLYPNALWYQPERLFLDETYEAWGIKVSSISGKGSSVEAKTIRGILNESGWGMPDFLKIDIEGAEEEIFQKDFELKQILNNVLCASIEPHSPQGEKIIKSVLAECGFTVEYHGELIYGFRY